MPSVTFATFAYWKDAPRIHQPGHLKKLINLHEYPFDEIILVHQRLTKEQKEQLLPINDVQKLKIVDVDDSIITEFGMDINDPIAACCSTGPTSPHFWPRHVQNHLATIKAATSEFIVFADSDISIIRNGPPNWVAKGIEILNRHNDVLLVSPDEGGTDMVKRDVDGRFTNYMSQQIFLIRRSDIMNMDWNVWWDWPKGTNWPDKSREGSPNGYLAPQQPFREFYPMAEGRIWRWMNKVKKYRYVLNTQWRYWHDGAANK